MTGMPRGTSACLRFPPRWDWTDECFRGWASHCPRTICWKRVLQTDVRLLS